MNCEAQKNSKNNITYYFIAKLPHYLHSFFQLTGHAYHCDFPPYMLILTLPNQY